MIMENEEITESDGFDDFLNFLGLLFFLEKF